MSQPYTTPAPTPPEHGCVRVRLRYTNGAKRTPWKWHAVCICGWHCQSWDWHRIIGHVDDHVVRALGPAVIR